MKIQSRRSARRFSPEFIAAFRLALALFECFNLPMLGSQNHMHRQMRILRQIERRRRVRSWVQVFQISMLLFFADQIVKTYCSGQLEEFDSLPILDQSFVQLTRVPDPGLVGKISGYLPAEFAGYPKWFALGFWLLVAGVFLYRALAAGFGELLAFGVVLSGGFSNLISQFFNPRPFDSLAFVWRTSPILTLNIADVCLLVGSFFLLRAALGQLQTGGARFSRQIP
jgi:lipoprotein signal peptidase